MAVIVELDLMLARRRMSVGDFANAVGITPANVAVLKNGRARAIRLSTLDAICRVLECQPGDILRWIPDETAAGPDDQLEPDPAS
jgi:putative transcriptional regulator